MKNTANHNRKSNVFLRKDNTITSKTIDCPSGISEHVLTIRGKSEGYISVYSERDNDQ